LSIITKFDIEIDFDRLSASPTGELKSGGKYSALKFTKGSFGSKASCRSSSSQISRDSSWSGAKLLVSSIPRISGIIGGF